MKKILIIIMLNLFSVSSYAADVFLSGSCDDYFPESMVILRGLIEKKGYTVSRVQHVDVGLRKRGYKTGLYRVVFFGKNEEIQLLRHNYPSLIPYIPLSITIFEDGNSTGINAIDPNSLQSIYDSDDIQSLVNTWSFDMVDIFREFSHC